MYRVSVTDSFSSAHQLKGYQGKCEEIHGHNWKVEVEVEGTELDEIGLLIDFGELKKILKEVIQELDHRMLNDLPVFREINPSSEHLARYIYHRIREALPKGISIHTIAVWESENSRAIYSEE